MSGVQMVKLIRVSVPLLDKKVGSPLFRLMRVLSSIQSEIRRPLVSHFSESHIVWCALLSVDIMSGLGCWLYRLVSFSFRSALDLFGGM